MTRPPITATGTVRADAARVYAIIADYRDGHPRIIPRPPFEELTVEQGGIGAGTVIRVGMRVIGRRHVFRAVVSEPEPGRVLAETDSTTGLETTFTVEPIADGCRVTIATALPERRGLLGWLEYVVSARFLYATYLRELRQLAAVAEQRSDAAVRQGASR